MRKIDRGEYQEDEVEEYDNERDDTPSGGDDERWVEASLGGGGGFVGVHHEHWRQKARVVSQRSQVCLKRSRKGVDHSVSNREMVTVEVEVVADEREEKVVKGERDGREEED